MADEIPPKPTALAERRQRMTLRKWCFGAIVALFLSLLVAGAGLAAGASWQSFVMTFCVSAVTHFGAWIRQHPPEKINI